jgi:hypothetical protein
LRSAARRFGHRDYVHVEIAHQTKKKEEEKKKKKKKKRETLPPSS